jgi:hypothetical protein
MARTKQTARRSCSGATPEPRPRLPELPIYPLAGTSSSNGSRPSDADYSWQHGQACQQRRNLPNIKPEPRPSTYRPVPHMAMQSLRTLPDITPDSRPNPAPRRALLDSFSTQDLQSSNYLGLGAPPREPVARARWNCQFMMVANQQRTVQHALMKLQNAQAGTMKMDYEDSRIGLESSGTSTRQSSASSLAVSK